MRIAQEALALVDQGVSERASVAMVVSSNPDVSKYRKQSLRLVIKTLEIRDLLDKTLLLGLDATPENRRDTALARLATCLGLTSVLGPDELRAFRELSSPGFRPHLEYLLGFLKGYEMDRVYEGLSELDKVALRTHHPTWWVAYCFKLLGRDETIRLLSADPRPSYVRVNQLRNRGKRGLPARAKSLKTRLSPSKFADGVFVLDGDASALAPFFAEGLFQLQDLASYLSVEAAEPTSGERVLDLCAAPGAKTVALAQFMRNKGTILSVDHSRERMGTWVRETRRLGTRCAKPLIGDASRLGLRGKFDLTLVDPPCSGTGILDRNPRMKWNLGPKLVEWFSQLQSQMMEEASRLTGEGGRILYCTCSVTLEENEEVISRFLVDHPEFETVPILKENGSPGLRGMTDCRRFYPHRDRTAGYFAARLQRTN